MTEQWEMCEVAAAADSIADAMLEKCHKIIFSSTGVQKSNFPMKDYEKLVCEFLAEGWEPFQSVFHFKGGVVTFRRRVS